MIDLYYWTTPNGHKITIFLEEAHVPYRLLPVNIGTGEQFKPEFLRHAPNNRIPPSSMTSRRTAASPSASSSPVPSCSTSARSPVASCRLIYAGVSR